MPPCALNMLVAILTCALTVQVQTASRTSSIAQYSPAMSELLAFMPTPEAGGPAPPALAPSQKRSCASSYSFGLVGPPGQQLQFSMPAHDAENASWTRVAVH